MADIVTLPLLVPDEIIPDDGPWNGETASGLNWQVFCGDAHSVLTDLEDNSFDSSVTSPPYFWLRDYNVENQIGLEDSINDYVNAICKVMDEVYRVLHPEGTLFLNIGDTYYSGKGASHGVDPKSKKRRFGLRAVDRSGGLGIGLRPKTAIGIPWRVAIEMMGRGWILRSPIIWNRQHCLPEAVMDRPRRSYENIFMFTKSRKYYFNRQALPPGEEDLWTIVARPKSTGGLETAPFPDELVQRCLAIGCREGGRVIDPFAGSGTTLRVALGNKYSATGIDLNRDFCNYIVSSLKKMS